VPLRPLAAVTAASAAGLPVLPTYIARDHDLQLRESSRVPPRGKARSRCWSTTRRQGKRGSA